MYYTAPGQDVMLIDTDSSLSISRLPERMITSAIRMIM